MTTEYKHQLTAPQLAKLFELLYVEAAIKNAESVIEGSNDPRPVIANLVPGYVVKAEEAKAAQLRQKLQRMLDELGKENLEVAIAFQEARLYIKPLED